MMEIGIDLCIYHEIVCILASLDGRSRSYLIMGCLITTVDIVLAHALTLLPRTLFKTVHSLILLKVLFSLSKDRPTLEI